MRPISVTTLLLIGFLVIVMAIAVIVLRNFPLQTAEGAASEEITEQCELDSSLVSRDVRLISITPGAATATEASPGRAGFVPPVVDVKVGTTITWKNNDDHVHSVTSGDPLTDDAAQLFDSGIIYPGETFQYTFDSLGTYPYFDIENHCNKGLIIVTKETSGPMPSSSLDQEERTTSINDFSNESEAGTATASITPEAAEIPCGNTTTAIEHIMLPLNETSKSLQQGNFSAAMNNLNTTHMMLEQLKGNNNTQTNTVLSNTTSPSDRCSIASDIDRIMLPLNETSKSLQQGNFSAAMNNLNTTHMMLEQLKQ